MWKLFKKDPAKAKRRQRDALLEAAFQAQRNGNIREYSRLTTEADELTKALDKIDPQGGTSNAQASR